MRLAITTPTGKIGAKLVDELLARGGHELRLMTRDRNMVDKAVERGAEPFEGRLEDRAFFARATAGVDALFFVLPMNSRSAKVFDECNAITDSAVEAIRANHIDRVVFVSSLGAHLDAGSGPILALRDAERKLRDATANLTVLRPVMFMDRVLGWVDDIAEKRAFYTALPDDAPMPMVATRDVANYAADVLTDDTWTGRRVLPIYGPREYSLGEVASILGKTLGKEIRHVGIEPGEVANKLRHRGWSEPAVERAVELEQLLAAGKLADDLPPAERVERPTTFEEFARRDFLPAYRKVAPTTTVG